MDQDLERIRAARLAELKKQHPNAAGSLGQSIQKPMSGNRDGKAQPSPEEEEEAMHIMLSQLLEPKARERLQRIMLVKPQRAKEISNFLMTLARNGRIREKISDDKLIQLLDQQSQSQESSKAIKIERKGELDEFDDDYD